MGLRFNRRVKICKGVTLNLGKKGASVSVGTRGARMTFGKNGTRTTLGIPGTGLSYTDYQPRKKKKKLRNQNSLKNDYESIKATGKEIKTTIDKKIDRFETEAKSLKDTTLLKEYKVFLTLMFSGFACVILGLFKVQFDLIAMLLLVCGLIYILVNRQVLQCQYAIYYYNYNRFDKSLKYCNKILKNRNSKEELVNKATEVKDKVILLKKKYNC